MANPTTIENAHRIINERARDIANADHRLGPFGLQDPFRIPTNSGLGLRIWAPGLNAYLSEEDQETLRQIGREAIKKAIVEQGDLFGGLIVGHARKGKNYFDVLRNMT